jgi:hypothetical protein
MADKDEVIRQLAPLTTRADVPQEVREIVANSIKDIPTPLNSDVWIYRAVVMFLGVSLLLTVSGGIALAIIAKGDTKIALPEALVAIGSAAVGALAGLLAPSPVKTG